MSRLVLLSLLAGAFGCHGSQVNRASSDGGAQRQQGPVRVTTARLGPYLLRLSGVCELQFDGPSTGRVKLADLESPCWFSGDATNPAPRIVHSEHGHDVALVISQRPIGDGACDTRMAAIALKKQQLSVSGTRENHSRGCWSDTDEKVYVILGLEAAPIHEAKQ